MLFHLGIDVSKAKLDLAMLLPTDKFKSKVFANDAKGFAALLEWMRALAQDALGSVHICMESTGSYHEALACFLHDQGLHVSVVNPLLVKRFAEAAGLRNKTDGGDAKCIAQFCKMHKPSRWEAPSKALRALQALVARLDALQAMRQGECSRLDVAHASVLDSIQQVIADLDEAIDKVKALIAYASLTPLIRQSGTSLDKRRGTHPMGHQELRRALYFPAMVAGRYNPLVAAFWQRLKAQNKPGKVIVVACMHKLLAIAYGVLRSDKPFDLNHSGLQKA